MTLNKKYILITRPIDQADYLSRLILDNDGISVKFPTIDIRPLDKTKELIMNFNKIKDSDILIFVSRNAVRVAVDGFIRDINIFKNIKIIGVGAGTMGELEKTNFKNIIYSEQSDSEGVLNLSDMQSEK
ncbi:MAG: uroporphyrinogen-III synthase, partial [Gammaproteobacteria bacterium]